MTITLGPVSDAGLEFDYPDGELLRIEPLTTYRWSGKVDVEPWFWRRLMGKAHPRISRMHSRYPRRWRRKR